MVYNGLMITWDEDDQAIARRRGWTLDAQNGFIEAHTGWKARKGHIWLQVWDEALDSRLTALRALWVLRVRHPGYFRSVQNFAFLHERRISNVVHALDQLEQDQPE